MVNYYDVCKRCRIPVADSEGVQGVAGTPHWDQIHSFSWVISKEIRLNQENEPCFGEFEPLSSNPGSASECFAKNGGHESDLGLPK